MLTYIAYGMRIESDFCFGALLQATGLAPSVTFEVERVESFPPPPEGFTRLGHAQGRNLYFVIEEGSVTVRVGAFLIFAFSPGHRRIRCTALQIVPDELLRYWTVQHIVPMYLLWEGKAEFLHGMAVSALPLDTAGSGHHCKSSGCLGFLGDSFAGKSTMLDYFLSRGHILVTDDHLAVSRKNYLDALPATPYYRPYREHEDLGIAASLFSPEPLPLRHLFLLEPAPAYADIVVEELQGIAAVAAVLPHIQYNLHNPQLQHLYPLVAERFRGLNQLVRNVPAKRLYVPRDKTRLPAVYDRVQQELTRKDSIRQDAASSSL